MKCIMNNDHVIKRVSDKKAILMTKDGSWKYIPKSIWKKNTRKLSSNKSDNNKT